MKPVVHQLAHSPYCLPVTRALEALGVAYTVVNHSNADRSALLRLTGGAYYQVPVIDWNGTVVYDRSPEGLDVPRFLDREFAGGRLFPSAVEGLQQLLVPHIENEVELPVFKLTDIHYIPSIADLVERGMVVRHKERRFGRGCVEQWRASRAELLAEAVRLMTPYDLMAAQGPFLLGEQPVYADFALYGILANLTYNGWNAFPEALPNLRRWFDRISAFRYPM